MTDQHLHVETLVSFKWHNVQKHILVCWLGYASVLCIAFQLCDWNWNVFLYFPFRVFCLTEVGPCPWSSSLGVGSCGPYAFGQTCSSWVSSWPYPRSCGSVFVGTPVGKAECRMDFEMSLQAEFQDPPLMMIIIIMMTTKMTMPVLNIQIISLHWLLHHCIQCFINILPSSVILYNWVDHLAGFFP